MRRSAFQTFCSNRVPSAPSGSALLSALAPAKYASSHSRVRSMTPFEPSSTGGAPKKRVSRLSSRDIRLSDPNSSAQSASSDASASIGPTGVGNVARRSRIVSGGELYQVSDDRTLLLGELPDAFVGQPEQRVERLAVEGQPLGRTLHLDETPVAGLDDVHVDFGAGVVFVGEIEQRLTVDDADADCGDRIVERNRPQDIA